ncbi:hypothetical protein IQ62_04750 [Streptomyces scabiei]|uniref:hypothetical protein n=1 Tax=Streptomyces scabiei TaxID=1930 RepID=UPI0004E6688A|nr:hypothetical protein [Streptomyces scabiei]KFG02011.1 hypothetical protein IQ62_04750 [Streptomyces scabiei]
MTRALKRHDKRTGAGSDMGPDAEPSAGPDEQVERRAPDSPTDLSGRSRRSVLKRALKEFRRDQLTDRAAAMTSCGILRDTPSDGLSGLFVTHVVISCGI